MHIVIGTQLINVKFANFRNRRNLRSIRFIIYEVPYMKYNSLLTKYRGTL